MHPVFVSEGIVLGKRGIGEENTFVSMLTDTHGLIKASARAARRESSKLRYGLEPLTLATFSFIRGKYEWKITGAQNISHELVAQTIENRMASGRVARLILRLVHGEDLQQGLYTTVKEGLGALARVPAQEGGANVEAVLVLRIMSRLGYLPDTPELRPFIERDFFSLELASEIAASRKLIIKAINESLDATGL